MSQSEQIKRGQIVTIFYAMQVIWERILWRQAEDLLDLFIYYCHIWGTRGPYRLDQRMEHWGVTKSCPRGKCWIRSLKNNERKTLPCPTRNNWSTDLYGTYEPSFISAEKVVCKMALSSYVLTRGCCYRKLHWPYRREHLEMHALQ